MGCVKFLTDNYADLDLLANYTVSSEQTAFPVTNAFNLNRRSKVWRSNGYWKIESGSNTIVFNEGGSDLTATVAAGEYTSTSSFLTAIDTAFSTAPAAAGSYSITTNSQLKTVITKSAGTFNIKWTHADSADMAGILGFDTDSDDTGALSYTADILKINTEESIIFDFGIASLPTALAITGPRNRALKLSPGGVYTIELNHTDNFSTSDYSEALTYDSEVIALLREDGIDDVAHRYAKLKFVDQNPLGYIEIGAIFIGQYFEPTRGAVQFPFEIQPIDRTDTVTSESGVTFSDIREQTGKYNFNWAGLTKGDRENILDIFERYGTGKPFFISFDTNAAFSSDFNRMLKFVQFDAEPRFSLQSPNNFSCSMTVIEQI